MFSLVLILGGLLHDHRGEGLFADRPVLHAAGTVARAALSVPVRLAKRAGQAFRNRPHLLGRALKAANQARPRVLAGLRPRCRGGR